MNIRAEEPPLLHIHDLTKRYPGRRGVQANDGINLDIRPGKVLGLFGHNGAGKTTLVNSIVGLVRPDSGSITIDGIDAIAHPDLARRLAAVQAQTNVPVAGLTPRQAITTAIRIRGLDKDQAMVMADTYISDLKLDQWADTPGRKTSGGVARLTTFCMTAAAPARLHIFDEPTNDVDPARRVLLWNQVRNLADQGGAVLVTTHNVREAADVVDRVVILDYGRVLRAGTPQHIIDSSGANSLESAYLAIVGAEEREEQ